MVIDRETGQTPLSAAERMDLHDRSLGIEPIRVEKSAKLYDANKFPTICRLIAEAVMAKAFKKAA